MGFSLLEQSQGFCRCTDMPKSVGQMFVVLTPLLQVKNAFDQALTECF